MFFILGVGGFSKEVLFLCKDVYGSINDFGGFIDINPNSGYVKSLGTRLRVIPEVEFEKYVDKSHDLIIGTGNPLINCKVASKFSGFNFPNLFHPSFIGHLESTEIGLGNIVTAGCIFTVDIKIGSFNIFNLNTTVGHDAVIGNYNIFNPGANISGSVTIGDLNLVGTNSCILQGVNFGNRSIIGAAAMVNKNFEDYTTVVGVPARPLNK